MMIVLVACTNEPTDDGDTGGGDTGIDPNATFIENAAGTHTVAGVEYTVAPDTGHITFADGTYYHVSVNHAEDEAVYSTTLGTDAVPATAFLAAAIEGDPKEFSLYLENRVDFWTDANAAYAGDEHKVGKSATDAFVIANATIEVTEADNTTKNTYDVDKIHGHLLATGTTDIMYHYMGQFNDTSAYFRKVEGEKFLGIAVVDGVSKTYIKDKLTLWDTKDEVRFIVAHEIGGDADKTFIKNAAGKHTVAGVEYTVAPDTGEITFAGGTYSFDKTLADPILNEIDGTMAAYETSDGSEFLGAKILVNFDGTKLFTLYLKDRVDFWTLAESTTTPPTPSEDYVEILPAHEVGRSATDLFVRSFRTVDVTVNNIDPTDGRLTYNVNEFTGHLTTTVAPDTIAYHYMGEAGAGQAYFRNEDKKFLGIAVVDGVSKTYMEKRNTPWTTKTDVVFHLDNEVGERDVFVKNNQTVTVTANHASPTTTTYDVDPISGDLKTGQTVVHTYQGYNSDTQAYFKNEATSEFFGIEQITANTTFKTYINKRGLNGATPWATKDDVKFGLEHEVGGVALELGVVWTDIGDLPAKKETFSALKNGNKIWLVGKNNNVFKSTDQGVTWTSTVSSGLAEHENTTGAALADDKLFVATPNAIYKSVNDGLTWESVKPITGEDQGFKAIHVTDSDNTGTVPNGIYFIGKNNIVHSTDGDTWTTTPITTKFENREIYGMNVTVHKSAFYVVAGWPSDKIYKSTDAGKNWTEVATTDPRWGTRDRAAVVSTLTEVYLIGGKDGNTHLPNVWKSTFASGLTVWTQVVESGDFGGKYGAEALYFPADSAGTTHKERLLLMGGTGNDKVWRTEAE